MHRRHVARSPLAIACQTGALLLILLGIVGLLAHSIAERRSEQTVGAIKLEVR